MRYNVLEDLKPEPKVEFDWEIVPEAHGTSGAAAAHYLGEMLRTPVRFMDVPLETQDWMADWVEPQPEAEGELPTFRGMLRNLGRVIGETGLLGSEASPEDPWGGYELTPEIMEEALPLAIELGLAYPAGIRAMQAGAEGMVWGAESLMTAAARPVNRAAKWAAEGLEALNRARLPSRIAKTSERLGALGEEASAAAEWFMDVGEAQKLARIGEAEKDIGYTINWLESSMAAEEEMAMKLATETSPQAPRAPGPGSPRIEGRIEDGYPPKGPASTSKVLEDLSDGIPVEEIDPYDYMGAVTAERLKRANVIKRGEIKHATAVMRVRATAQERAALNEIEATGLRIDDPFDPTLEVSPDKFDRVSRAVEELKAELPPKLQTEIRDRIIPEMTADLRYTTEGQALKRRQSMAGALNEGLPKAEHITAEEILNSNKDPNLREKLARLMARRIQNKPWYKDKAQGFAETGLLMRMGEMGFGAVTGGAIDEENRLRGVIIGALAAFTLGTVLRFGRGLGGVGTVGRGNVFYRSVHPNITAGSTEGAGLYLAENRTFAKSFISEYEASLQEVRLGKAKKPLFVDEPGGDKLYALSGLWDDLIRDHNARPRDPWIRANYNAAEEIGLAELKTGESMYTDVFGRSLSEELRAEGFDLLDVKGRTGVGENVENWKVVLDPGLVKSSKEIGRHGGKGAGWQMVEDILKDETGAWNIRQMQEKMVQEAEVAGPEGMRQPEYTRAEAKARGMRRQHQKDIYGKGIGAGMTRDEVRAWTVDTYGKGLSKMSEAELAVANQDMTRRAALSKIIPEGQIDTAVKVREIEDLAMELYGSRASKRIDRAVRRTVGAHRDLRQLDQEQLTSVLEVLPKRFLGGRGFGALARQPMAVEDVMNKMGTWGKFITRQVRRERLQTEYLWSKWTTPLLEDVKNLNEADMGELVAALHPLEANGRRVVVPQDERLAQMAVRIRQTLNEVGELRKGIGDPIRLANGTEVPFELMQDYYPLHIAPDELTTSIGIKRRVMEHLIESGQAAGASDALTIYNEFINKSITNRFGNLDYAREAWIEPAKFDLVKDLSRYYYGAAKRISRHQYYGKATGTDLPVKMATWLDSMKRDVSVDEFNYAHRAMTKHFKHDAVDDAMSDMLKRIRSFETVAHMGLASIMNASEPVHTAVFAGFQNFAKGFARAVRSTSAMDARELVARNAAAVGSTLRDLIGESGGAGSLTGKFLKVTGFSPIEKWNRKLASHVGIQYIEDVASKLVRNPSSPRLRGMLDELLVNPNDVLKQGLTEETLIKGAMELANRTQKRTGVIDMPLFMSHPVGRIFTMFKTFSYGAARLMTRDFLLAAHRNPERLLRLLVAFPIVGELVGDVRNLATGKIRETEGLARLAENFAYVGTLGIFYDFLKSAQFGESAITGFMVGPVGSDIASILAGTHDWLMEGKGRKLQKQALRSLPPPATLLRGPDVQRAVFGKEFFPPPTRKWQIP